MHDVLICLHLGCVARSFMGIEPYLRPSIVSADGVVWCVIRGAGAVAMAMFAESMLQTVCRKMPGNEG